MSTKTWKVKVYVKGRHLASILVEASTQMNAENAVWALCKNTVTDVSAT